MSLESVVRKTAQPFLLAGAAAYLILNALACNGAAAPTQVPTASPTVAATATATPIPGVENVMSQEQVKATLEEILAFGRPLTYDDESRTVWKKVEAVNKSIYFHITGRTFEQDKFVTSIVTREEFYAAIGKNWAGTISIRKDGIYIYAIGDPSMYASSSRTLVLLVANETGQAKDTRWEEMIQKDPRLREKLYLNAAHDNEYAANGEASKHLYQSAVLHFLEELGVNGLSVADTLRNREQIRIGFERAADSGAFQTEGLYLAWWYALNDLQAKQELESTGKLRSATALELSEKVRNDLLSPDYAQRAQTVLSAKQSLMPRILEASYKRLVPNGVIKDVLPADAEYLFVP